ncbi:MAG: hypothetical protein HZB16_19215 [Armatimonadetes bacterium]|nr:hypothetical protein [Armatimonadota bacterium]
MRLAGLLVLAMWAASVSAAPSVYSEYGEIRDGRWRFATVAGPSATDAARGAECRLGLGALAPQSGPLTGLTDGVVSAVGDDPAQAVFLANSCVRGGTLLMDLGRAQPLAQIRSYSYHQWKVDQGGRGPQVYALAGALSPDGPWTDIARVDSRPNTTGANWGNRPQVARIAGALGTWRYLRFVIEPTWTPLLRQTPDSGETWSNTFFTEIDVDTEATMAHAEPASLYAPWPDLREVVIVFKTHFDIGYTDLARNIVTRYRTTMIDQALAVVDQSRGLPPEQQFVWTVPAWPMTKILEDWPGQTAERRARLQAAFAAGRFAVQAMPFTVQTEALEPETLIRGLGLASGLARAAGQPLPRAAKMTDVPSHSWILPTLLRAAGVEFLHLGVNGASAVPRVPLLFRWQGADGSELLTMLTGEYGSGLTPPPGWPHRAWLAMVMTGDNHGPPTPGEVRALLDEARAKLPGVKVRVGRLEDFYDALGQPEGVPVVRGDMPDTWIHGIACDPAGMRVARALPAAAAAARTLATTLGAWSAGTVEVGADLAHAYEQALLYGEHTWGGALYWVTQYGPPGGTGSAQDWHYGAKWREELAAGRFQRLQESWEEHTAYATGARDAVAAATGHALTALAQDAPGEGRRIVVFNPLPWERDGEVRVDLPGTAIAALAPVDGGDAVPAVAEGNSLRFVARHVPPGGYRVYEPIKAELRDPGLRVDESTGVLESRWLKVTLDPKTCSIASIQLRRDGRELVQPGCGRLLHERFDFDHVRAFTSTYLRGNSDWGFAELGKPNLPPSAEAPYQALSPADATLRLSRDALAATGEMTAQTPFPVSLRVVVGADRPYVDLELTVDKPADNWPEAGWLVLPIAADQPRFCVGRAGSVMDPAKDIVPGTNRHLLAVSTGVTVLGANGRGAGLCGPDTPLVSLGEPGIWRYDLDYVPTRPVVYFNLYNNQWTTNYRFWCGGRLTWRFRLWAADSDATEPYLITPATELRQPLLATVATGPAGHLPASAAGLSLSRRGIEVLALGANPDGEGTLLRVWEQAGTSGPVTVSLPGSWRTAQPVDLRGTPVGAAIAVEGGRFTAQVRGFAPAAWVLR